MSREKYEKLWADGLGFEENRMADLHKLENPRPHFNPYDICRVVGTDEYVLVTEINCNTSQIVDEYQWSYAVEPITSGIHKCAWWEAKELEYVANVFEIIAKKSKHPFSASAYKFRINSLKRDSKGES